MTHIPRGAWWLLPLAIGGMLIAHLYLLSHLAVSATVLAGAGILVLIKHLGFFGAVRGFLRRKSK